MDNRTEILLDKLTYSYMELKQKLYYLGVTEGDVQNIMLQARGYLKALKEQVAVPSIQKPTPCGKLRSVDETYKLIIQNDPESSITKTGLRRLIATGVIPSVRVGRNIKLNYDAVMAALSKGSTEPAREQKTSYGGIRKVV